MRVGSKSLTAIALGMMLFGVSSQARAATIPSLNGSGAWRFSGNCIDCAAGNGTLLFPVTATLTLKDYTQGVALTNTNFVSFVYDGSNLLYSYAVPIPYTFGSLSGNLTAGGTESLFLNFNSGGFLDFNSGGYFYMTTGKTWETCDYNCGVAADYGTNGNLRLDGPSTVPEPGTYALLAFGLGTLGVASKFKGRAR